MRRMSRLLADNTPQEMRGWLTDPSNRYFNEILQYTIYCSRGGVLPMAACHATNNRHRSARMKGSTCMGLTVMEKQSLEASIKKNQEALELLGRH